MKVDYTYCKIQTMPNALEYEHLLIEQTHLQWNSKTEKGEERQLDLYLAIHPNTTGRIIINYPGYKGVIDGYENKHRKLALFMQGENLGAVVRGKGPGFSDFEGFTVETQLRKMIEYSLENALFISGVENPELLLIGTSAGGGAAATIAVEYPAVSRILLMAPGANGKVEALRNFTGEVFIVIGENDNVVGTLSGNYFYSLAINASKR